jgi:hypothetical protein
LAQGGRHSGTGTGVVRGRATGDRSARPARSTTIADTAAGSRSGRRVLSLRRLASTTAAMWSSVLVVATAAAETCAAAAPGGGTQAPTRTSAASSARTVLAANANVGRGLGGSARERIEKVVRGEDAVHRLPSVRAPAPAVCRRSQVANRCHSPQRGGSEVAMSPLPHWQCRCASASPSAVVERDRRRDPVDPQSAPGFL